MKPLVLALLSFVPGLVQDKPKVADPVASQPTLPATVRPVPREEPWWVERHELLNERAKTSPELVFIGDSITQGWEIAGAETWERAYKGRSAINLGISGDRTQHVLWRLEHGHLPDGLAPKLCVVMIGTNNAGDDSSADIAEGVTAIVRKLWTELPKTRILVLSIFPRGADAKDERRVVNTGANERIAKLPGLFEDGRVSVLDIGSSFVAKDGTLLNQIMPDRLHLSPEGYERWARAIEPSVARMLGEEPR